MFLLRLTIVALLSSVFAFSQSVGEWVKKGNDLEAQGKTKQALEAFQKAEAKSPKDSEILIKIAKQYGDLMPSLKGKAKQQAAEKSLNYSRKAVAINPKASDSHLALALSLGKCTAYMSNGNKIKASSEIKSSAETALKLNKKSDYAHHMLGRWHQEMAGIGGGSRFLAKMVYGEVPKGSYAEALNHFDTARKLQPKRLIHQIEYGRTLAMMGREAEAKTEIKKGMGMPNREADDAESKVRGKATLDNL